MSHRNVTAAFRVDRIWPLPQSKREFLIDKYFDEDPEICEETKKDAKSNNCLVRVYLGEHESSDQESLAYDSLEVSISVYAGCQIFA